MLLLLIHKQYNYVENFYQMLSFIKKFLLISHHVVTDN